MIKHDKDKIEAFFSTIEPRVTGYSYIDLSYFAVRKGDDNLLLQARLFLRTAPSTIPELHVETDNMVAGHISNLLKNITLKAFVDRLIQDCSIETPHGKFIFPLEGDGKLSTSFDPFHQEGITGGNRLSVLSITGGRGYTYVEHTKFDWELKSASEPFDTIEELLTILVLGGKLSNTATLEIVAYEVAAINFQSIVNGVEAKPSIYLANSLDTRKCKIGYRVFMHGKVVDRGSIQGSDLIWIEKENFQQGEGLVAIPQGAVLHCIASYGGYAQHQGWIADPTNYQNSRRVSLESFDDQAEILREYLFDEQKTRKYARDFEFGVAWLMWILGFSVTQIGGTARTSDAPDILATSPKGNILVVECTVGLLKAEHKLAILVDRTEAVRKRLIASGNGHLKILPIIVTAKTKEEVKADLDQARNLGVIVVTQETLLDLFQQTIAAPDAEIIYERALDSLSPKSNFMDPAH